jgi:hypothetical protein
MEMLVMRLLLALCLTAFAAAPALAAGNKDKGWTSYGATLSKGRFEKLSAVTAPTPEGKSLRLGATIVEVCQKKGCWMNVGEGDATLRVEFEDYGFFVPSTAGGRPVQMEGVVVERTLTEAEREHFQEESESGAPVPERLLVFVARGVRIQGGGAIPAAQRARIEGRTPEPEGDGSVAD